MQEKLNKNEFSICEKENKIEECLLYLDELKKALYNKNLEMEKNILENIGNHELLVIIH